MIFLKKIIGSFVLLNWYEQVFFWLKIAISIFYLSLNWFIWYYCYNETEQLLIIFLSNFRIDSPGTPRRRSSANGPSSGRRSSSLTPNPNNPETSKPFSKFQTGNTPRGSVTNIANRGRSSSNHQLMMNGRQLPQHQQQQQHQQVGGVKNLFGRGIPPPPPPPLYNRSKSPSQSNGAMGYQSHKHVGSLVIIETCFAFSIKLLFYGLNLLFLGKSLNDYLRENSSHLKSSSICCVISRFSTFLFHYEVLLLWRQILTFHLK